MNDVAQITTAVSPPDSTCSTRPAHLGGHGCPGRGSGPNPPDSHLLCNTPLHPTILHEASRRSGASSSLHARSPCGYFTSCIPHSAPRYPWAVRRHSRASGLNPLGCVSIGRGESPAAQFPWFDQQGGERGTGSSAQWYGASPRIIYGSDVELQERDCKPIHLKSTHPPTWTRGRMVPCCHGGPPPFSCSPNPTRKKGKRAKRGRKESQRKGQSPDLGFPQEGQHRCGSPSLIKQRRGPDTPTCRPSQCSSTAHSTSRSVFSVPTLPGLIRRGSPEPIAWEGTRCCMSRGVGNIGWPAPFVRL